MPCSAASRSLRAATPGLDLERGASGAQRVVLVRDGDPERGHDRVAGELLDRASVAGQRGGDRVEVPAEDPAERLRVERVRQRHRLDDVARRGSWRAAGTASPADGGASRSGSSDSSWRRIAASSSLSSRARARSRAPRPGSRGRRGRWRSASAWRPAGTARSIELGTRCARAAAAQTHERLELAEQGRVAGRVQGRRIDSRLERRQRGAPRAARSPAQRTARSRPRRAPARARARAPGPAPRGRPPPRCPAGRLGEQALEAADVRLPRAGPEHVAGLTPSRRRPLPAACAAARRTPVPRARQCRAARPARGISTSWSTDTTRRASSPSTARSVRGLSPPTLTRLSPLRASRGPSSSSWTSFTSARRDSVMSTPDSEYESNSRTEARRLSMPALSVP